MLQSLYHTSQQLKYPTNGGFKSRTDLLGHKSIFWGTLHKPCPFLMCVLWDNLDKSRVIFEVCLCYFYTSLPASSPT